MATVLRVDPDQTIELEARWRAAEGWLLEPPGATDDPLLRDVAPVNERQVYRGSDFSAFVPSTPVAVGDVWWVDESSARFLLRQLHPLPVTIMDRETAEAAGTWACLRALSEDYAEVVTRSHLRFVLGDEDIDYVPGQFEGRLLVNRSDGAIESFELEVPRRSPNLEICMRRLVPPGVAGARGASGIGYVPEMSLSSIGEPTSHGNWSREIGWDKARALLRARFYSAIEWVAFEDAVALSARSGKPLHLLVILGTLDDESC